MTTLYSIKEGTRQAICIRLWPEWRRMCPSTETRYILASSFHPLRPTNNQELSSCDSQHEHVLHFHQRLNPMNKNNYKAVRSARCK